MTEDSEEFIYHDDNPGLPGVWSLLDDAIRETLAEARQELAELEEPPTPE